MSDFFNPDLERPQLLDMEDASFPDEDTLEPIYNLIVTVKAPNTVGALLSIQHRLRPESSILFLQNGMGIVDQVNDKVFPDPETRPNYMIGIISHGVNSHAQGLFAATHAGQGTISMGILPRQNTNADTTPTTPVSSRYILRTVCRSPVLAAVGATPTEVLQAQLEKLAINAIINPLTAIADARNGAILHNMHFKRAIRLLLAEISLVILAMPELKSLPNLGTRFSTARLEDMVVAVAFRTANNISSMLADIQHGKQSEIDYMNGYIVKRGEELGITCFMNFMITQLIKGKQQVVDHEKNEELPLARPK